MGDLLKTRDFLLSEKLFSARDRAIVMDASGKPLGIFSSKLFAIGGRTYRLDDVTAEDTTILTVKEKAVSLRSTYTFFKGDMRDGNEIGRLKREIVSFVPRFWFEDRFERALLTMNGDVFGLDYKVFRGDNVIADISKELFNIRDTYGVRLDLSLDDDTTMVVLGLVIVVHHEKEKGQA